MPGLTFRNEEARRSHFLGRLREGLEELHAKLGGVSYTSLDDAVAANGGSRALAHGRQGAASPPRRAHASGRFVEGPAPALEGRSRLSPRRDRGHPEPLRPALAHACPNPFLAMRSWRPAATPAIRMSRIAASRSRSTSARARPIPSTGRTAITPRCRIWRSCPRSSTTPSPAIWSWTVSLARA